jgi:hypothetical protein
VTKAAPAQEPMRIALFLDTSDGAEGSAGAREKQFNTQFMPSTSASRAAASGWSCRIAGAFGEGSLLAGPAPAAARGALVTGAVSQ